MYTNNLIVLFSLVLSLVVCHPTRYKINNNDQLEPDLIPVSSTVIPLPIYRVETSLNASAGKSSLVKPDGPVTLLTVHGNKSLPTGKETKVSGKDSKNQ